ncbi:MAG: DUF3306 domain-containing protein [Gammaproteobacteria bacterium]|nr:DUF3306 domain-containing protein [Gammaproteobacteria bacterium]
MSERFLSRWARRKSGAVSPSDAPPAEATPAEAAPTPPVKTAPAPASPPQPTDDDMPPIESLRDDSDFSGFLSPGVSEDLRRRALRRLFASAVFNVRDGLDDYDDDFRNFPPLGDLVTSDMRHQRELAEARAKAKREAAGDEGEKRAVADENADKNENEHESGDADDGESAAVVGKQTPPPAKPA